MSRRDGRVLLHLCCGPCTAGSLHGFRKEGVEATGFFYNPNIHPVTELAARVSALGDFAGKAGLPVVWRPDYGLDDFVRAASGLKEGRCEYCYVMRMRETAREARRRGFGLFSTTLLYSIHQKHNLLRDISEQAAREEGVDFLYLDLREDYREGRELWRETGLYSQKYCGCIFSEEERYRKRLAGLPRDAEDESGG